MGMAEIVFCVRTVLNCTAATPQMFHYISRAAKTQMKLAKYQISVQQVVLYVLSNEPLKSTLTLKRRLCIYKFYLLSQTSGWSLHSNQALSKVILYTMLVNH